MADRFRSTVEVNAPVSACYTYWHNFENFPNFMENVKSVKCIGGESDSYIDSKSHWVVNGPLGKDIEWDAVVDGDEPNKLISWHTVDRPDQKVKVQGAVRFDEIGADRCQITCTIQYEAGGIGEAVASIFSNPQKMVDEDMAHFKELVEGGRLGNYEGTSGQIGSDTDTSGSVRHENEKFPAGLADNTQTTGTGYGTSGGTTGGLGKPEA